MANLVTKFRYYKPKKSKTRGNYVKYVATRDGVEKIPKNDLNKPASKNQTDLIKRILRDFPDSVEMHEYADYINSPTVETASEFITRAIEDNINIFINQPTYRTLLLPTNIAGMLQNYKTRVDSEWVFPSPIKDNMPRDPSAVRKKLANVLERANCKHIRFHALRHTFATMALQYGLDIKTLSSTIGHSSVELTIDTYSHVTDNMRYAAADKIDSTIGRNKGKQGSTKRAEESEAKTEKFEAYKGKKRKPGTGYVKQISANSWQGRYTPTIDGKRVSKNIYAPTEEECERKLAEMIAEIKEEIKASKQSGIAMI